MKKLQDITVPAFGHPDDAAVILSLYKNVGDQITKGEVVCRVEQDEVVCEIEAALSGTLEILYAEEGDTVWPGETLAKVMD